ncbi:chalcone isomerase family protein [Inmirania thermothiophila]|uniref:Chalcone isomerase-like protein n=1 Tax=Inmirania thermothiophila TaxID=1750597 RepID=A0A3N1XT77_9GAMM|nr:chalcone isomerase family protein [Inmirania thermothiophila]ROR29843.1 chalcone isomerase-like protein [Inmirania thermothiophila]
MIRSLVLLVTFLLAAPPAPAAVTVAGVAFAETARAADGSRLVLNGVGVRTKFFVKVYVAALYLPERSADPAAILARTGPRQIRMHFLYKAIDPERMAEAWREGFEANLAPGALEALESRIRRFVGLFGTMRRGDEVLLDYLPGEGTRVLVNGELRGTIPGREFNDALLAIFIGEHPATGALKRGLLGG